jgi:hypothetical protein
MTGNVVDRLGVQSTIVLNNNITTVTSNNALIDSAYAITIATTLAFTVGIIQVIELKRELNTLSYSLLVSFMSVSSWFCYFVSFRFVYKWLYYWYCCTGIYFSSTRYIWFNTSKAYWSIKYSLCKINFFIYFSFNYYNLDIY